MSTLNYLDPLVLSSLAPRLRDLMGNCTAREAAQCCMAVATAIQDNPKQGPRLMGLACAFLLAAEQSGISVTDMMTYVLSNSRATGEPLPPATLNAIRQFLKDNGIDCVGRNNADMNDITRDLPTFEEDGEGETRSPGLLN